MDVLRRVGFGRPGVAVLLTGGLLLAACRGEGAADAAGEARASAPATPEGARFTDSAGSLNALGELVLDAVLLSDTLGLERVRLTESEHNEQVWPEFPAARPEVNYPVDMAWENIDLRNRRDRGRLMRWFDGVEPETVTYRGVNCRGEVEPFETFRVHTDCYVLFERDDVLFEVQAFKDVLERGDGFKVFRYYDNQPERAAS